MHSTAKQLYFERQTGYNQPEVKQAPNKKFTTDFFYK